MKRLWNLTGWAGVGMWGYGVFTLGHRCLGCVLHGEWMYALGFLLATWACAFTLDRIACFCWDQAEPLRVRL
jgi:hypothetical protein